MPKSSSYAYETGEANVDSSDFTETADAIRSGFEDFIRVNFEVTGLLSHEQVSAQKLQVERVLRSGKIHSKEYQDLIAAYTGSFAEHSKKENLSLYFNEVIGPLQNAVSSRAISKKSYDEWIDWIRDPKRDSSDKKASITKTLPDYLDQRRKLATKRNGILDDKRFDGFQNSSDPTLKALAAKIADDDFFLDTLDISGREKLVTEVLIALPLTDDEKKLFAILEKDLEGAEREGLITGKSKGKWIARFKDPNVNIQAKKYFIEQQFPSYKEAWRKTKKQREEIMKDPLHKELTKKDVEDIKDFLDDKKFLALHHDAKLNLLAEVRSAMRAKIENKRGLHDETKAVLQAAAAAGYLSANKVGPWLEHVMAGQRSLKELKEFIKDWAKVRYRFDQVEKTMNTGKVPQGLQRMSLERFLNLSYDQKKSYVEEAERRLNIEGGSPRNTPIQDLKGKVRHALDNENWEEAQYYMKKAKGIATEDSDIEELKSMERYLRSFGSEKDADNEKKQSDINWAFKEIEAVLSMLPGEMQDLYRKALIKGPECLQCVTTCVYNRTWCQDRGYLSDSLEDKLRDTSWEETANRLSVGGEGHGDGLENNNVDGFNQPSIRDKGIGPQNIFLGSSGVDAFVEKANANKNVWSFWYWTNLIVDGVSGGQNNYVSRNLNHRIKRAARTLKKNGVQYTTSGPPIFLN